VRFYDIALTEAGNWSKPLNASQDRTCEFNGLQSECLNGIAESSQLALKMNRWLAELLKFFRIARSWGIRAERSSHRWNLQFRRSAIESQIRRASKKAIWSLEDEMYRKIDGWWQINGSNGWVVSYSGKQRDHYCLGHRAKEMDV
jgi:hypothetical protein